MKFREPRPTSKPWLKSGEVLAGPEEDRSLIFDIHDFFTTEEWDGLVDTLTKFDHDEDKVADFEARNFLDGALALRFLDQNKLEQLRNNTIAKRTIKSYLRHVQPGRLEDWASLNAIAVWLWPELEQVAEIIVQMTKFRKSAEKKTYRSAQDYLRAGEMALLYPDLKDQLGINEEWLQETSADINTTEGNSDYLKQQARFSIARELFFPPEFSAEDPSKVKDWIKQSLDDSREGLFFIDDLGDHLLTVAYARLVLKQDVSYSNAGVQITDRKLLGKSAPLPERTQI